MSKYADAQRRRFLRASESLLSVYRSNAPFAGLSSSQIGDLVGEIIDGAGLARPGRERLYGMRDLLSDDLWRSLVRVQIVAGRTGGEILIDPPGGIAGTFNVDRLGDLVKGAPVGRYLASRDAKRCVLFGLTGYVHMGRVSTDYATAVGLPSPRGLDDGGWYIPPHVNPAPPMDPSDVGRRARVDEASAMAETDPAGAIRYLIDSRDC